VIRLPVGNVDRSQKKGGNPEETRLLREDLRNQEAFLYSELIPFWMNFIDAALDGDPINFTLSLD